MHLIYYGNCHDQNWVSCKHPNRTNRLQRFWCWCNESYCNEIRVWPDAFCSFAYLLSLSSNSNTIQLVCACKFVYFSSFPSILVNFYFPISIQWAYCFLFFHTHTLSLFISFCSPPLFTWLQSVCSKYTFNWKCCSRCFDKWIKILFSKLSLFGSNRF